MCIPRSKFLGTNLQHCSDLGRAAFREAESGMRKLQLNLEDILGTRGTVCKTTAKQSRFRFNIADLAKFLRFEVSSASWTRQNVPNINFVVVWTIFESLPTTVEKMLRQSRKDLSECLTLLWLFKKQQRINKVC